jgi:hypothetical protein
MPADFRVGLLTVVFLAACMSVRSRFDGEPQVLVPVFVKHSNIPNFLGYTEDMAGPKQPEKLVRKRGFFCELAAIYPKLSFSQTFLEKVLELAYDECATKVWKRTMSESQKSSWKTSIAKQVRVACRHISQSKKTSWHSKVFEDADGGGDPAGDWRSGAAAAEGGGEPMADDVSGQTASNI